MKNKLWQTQRLPLLGFDNMFVTLLTKKHFGI